MTARPTPVSLDANSLYIVTQPLIHGAFHWSLIHTDGTGFATRHHWVEVSKRASQIDNVPKAEAHACQSVGTCLSRTKNSVILGYFKVEGYIPVPREQFIGICKGAFPISYRTVDENRKHTLTCRTWITSVLQGLEGRGSLKTSVSPKEIEQIVTDKSHGFERVYMSDFLWGRLYDTVVTTV
jgi:hypothetical protein